MSRRVQNTKPISPANPPADAAIPKAPEGKVVLLSCERAAAAFRAAGKDPCNPMSVWRWTRYGVRAGDKKVFLQRVKLSGQIFIPEHAIPLFLNAVAEAQTAALSAAANSPTLPAAPEFSVTYKNKSTGRRAVISGGPTAARASLRAAGYKV